MVAKKQQLNSTRTQHYVAIVIIPSGKISSVMSCVIECGSFLLSHPGEGSERSLLACIVLYHPSLCSADFLAGLAQTP